MDIDVTELSQTQAYHLMTQMIVPRPIAWVLSEHDNGELNLAPFSFFNAVCSSPPVLMLSIGRKSDGEQKDTFRNIAARKKFVVHIAHSAQASEVTLSAKELAAGESELELAGLETVPFADFPLPRLASARVAIGCELYRLDTIGDRDQNLVFGKIESVWIDDQYVALDGKGRVKICSDTLDALGRLGGSEYVTAGDVIAVVRPD